MIDKVDVNSMADREAVWAAETLAMVFARFGLWDADQIQRTIDIYQSVYMRFPLDEPMEQDAQQKLFEFMIAMREFAKQ